MHLHGVQGWWSNNQMTWLKQQTMSTGSKQPTLDAQASDQGRAFLSFPQLIIDIALLLPFDTNLRTMEAAQFKYSPTCVGDPVSWNHPTKTLYWGRRTAQLFPSVQLHPTMQDPLHVLYQFVHSRLDSSV